MDIVFAKDRNKKPNPFMGLWKKVVEKFKNFRFSNTFYYFLILIVISIGFYMLMLVQNGFTLAYGGDSTAQYIPMGYHIWDYYARLQKSVGCNSNHPNHHQKPYWVHRMHH